MWLICIAGIAALIYGTFILWQLFVWKKTSLFSYDKEQQFTTSVSVIVPVRNESAVLKNLIVSLLAQTYSPVLTEIIIVDDFSEDDSFSIACSFNDTRLKVIRSENSMNRLHKKMAVETGVRYATGDLIITTDADCIHSDDWIKTWVAYYELHQPLLMFSAITYLPEQNRLYDLQQAELSSLMLLTNATMQSGIPFMGNAANMAYPRSVFEHTGGYAEDITPSGDDTTLIRKIKATYGAGQIHFVKHPALLVKTPARPTFRTLLHQRVRWAGKSIHYPGFWSSLSGGIILVYYLAMLAMLPFAISFPPALACFFFLFIYKLLLDALLVFQYARYSGNSISFCRVAVSELFYFPYFVSVFVLALGKRYEWKHRTYHS